MYKPLLALAIAASALVSAPALPDTRSDQPGPAENAADVNITTHILQPRELPAAEVSALKVPAGFRVTRFARDLGNVRVLAVAPDGTVYATRRDEGDVIMFKDPGGGQPGSPYVRVASRSGLHGIALHKGKVYLATVHEIFRAEIRPDGTFGPLDMLIHDLPDAGQHNTRTV